MELRAAAHPRPRPGSRCRAGRREPGPAFGSAWGPCAARCVKRINCPWGVSVLWLRMSSSVIWPARFTARWLRLSVQDDGLPGFDRPPQGGIAIADPLPLHQVDLPGVRAPKTGTSLAAASGGGGAAETAGGDFVQPAGPNRPTQMANAPITAMLRSIETLCSRRFRHSSRSVPSDPPGGHPAANSSPTDVLPAGGGSSPANRPRPPQARFSGATLA